MKLTMKTLILLIIVLVMFGIVFAALSKTLFKLKTSKVPIEKCRLEVLKASQSSKTSVLKDFHYADCPVVDKGVIELPDDNKKASQKFGKFMVDEMHDCWYKFGEGNLNPLPGDRFDQAIHCYICTTFEVDKIVHGVSNAINSNFKIYDKEWKYLKDSFLYGIDGYPVYWLNVAYKSTDDFKKLKEYESFLGVEEGRPLEPNNNYYLINMFIVDKDGSFLFGTGALAGLNDHETSSRLALVSSHDIQKVCYSLEN